MNKIINLIFLWCCLATVIFAQVVDPVSTRANFVLNTIQKGDSSILTSNLSNNIFTSAVFECVDIQASVWLEGAYTGNSMHTKLNDLGYLPGQDPNVVLGIETEVGQPYYNIPWAYLGSEGDVYDYTQSRNYPATVTDWVLISLRTGTGENTTVCTRTGLLHADGHIELIASSSCCQIDLTQDYYVVIEHRNHLVVMSHKKQSVVSNTITYDFRAQQSYTGLFGFGQKVIGSQYVMYAGNGFQNSSNDILNIISSDDDNWVNENGEHSSYYIYDFDLNGDINVQDKHLWIGNNGIFSDVPR